MRWILYLLALSWIAAGAVAVLYSDRFRSTLSEIVAGSSRKIVALMPFVFGIGLLVSAGASRHAGIIRMLGILAVAKAGLIFFNPNRWYERILDWYLQSTSEQADRLAGIIAIILGTAIVSWIY